MTDWTNNRHMQWLLKQQEREREVLAKYLENPKPRYVVNASVAGWGVIDRMDDKYCEGFFATEKEAINAAGWLNRDDEEMGEEAS
jgi:hypothetical protein